MIESRQPFDNVALHGNGCHGRHHLLGCLCNFARLFRAGSVSSVQPAVEAEILHVDDQRSEAEALSEVQHADGTEGQQIGVHIEVWKMISGVLKMSTTYFNPGFRGEVLLKPAVDAAAVNNPLIFGLIRPLSA
jgi:hypothetical protein